jgi:hypothetical protein
MGYTMQSTVRRFPGWRARFVPSRELHDEETALFPAHLPGIWLFVLSTIIAIIDIIAEIVLECALHIKMAPVVG